MGIIMAYCEIADVKNYLDIEGAGDDVLIDDKIASAQKAIETITRRTFEDPGADATRYFTVGVDTDGLELMFDEDIYSITTVKTNADGLSPDTIPSTAYITRPRNKTPYYGIKILGSTNYYWDYTDDPEAGIEITGRWAYCESVPNDIVHLCSRWASYLYKQRDSQVWDTVAIPSAGIIQVPQGIPKDVVMLIDSYVRPRL